MIAPAIGLPVKVAKLIAVKFIPVRAPRLERSPVRLDTPAGNRLSMAPATIPYTTVQAYRPPEVLTAIHENIEIPAITETGISMFNGPTVSAK